MKRYKRYSLVITNLLLSFFLFLNTSSLLFANNEEAQGILQENSLHTKSLFSYLNGSDWIVSTVLLILVCLSILCWGICIAKLIYLDKLKKSNQDFIKLFWNSKSLKDLNAATQKEPYSPAKEIFKASYEDFERNNYLSKKELTLDTLIGITMNHLGRAVQNAKRNERKKLEAYLPLLAITASTAPFIGLLGTVWGIMNSFQSIALTGNASLSSVAPGLSEALIATAFGLAAAIPSAIGYSLANHKIRKLFAEVENFSGDFFSIIERYIVTEHKKP